MNSVSNHHWVLFLNENNNGVNMYGHRYRSTNSDYLGNKLCNFDKNENVVKVNGKSHRSMITNHVWEFELNNMWFQQDDISCHATHDTIFFSLNILMSFDYQDCLRNNCSL